MTTKDVTVHNPAGLHTYMAAEVTKVANEYRSDIWIAYGENRAVAKSLLGILALGVGDGADVQISANGADEGAAVEAIAALLERGSSQAGRPA